MKLLALVLAFTAAAVAADPNSTVANAAIAKKYFDALLASHAPYELAGVSKYDLRSYEIVQTTPEIVVARLTFGARDGSDAVRTKKFLVSDGRLIAADREDVRAEIRKNLEQRFSSAVFKLVRAEGEEKLSRPITLARFAAAGIELPEVESIEGEDYAKVSFDNKSRQPYGPGGWIDIAFRVSIADAKGIPVVYDSKP